jgi:thiamine pyrophosphate-dependent acetolactate synthase large subunit-like protein
MRIKMSNKYQSDIVIIGGGLAGLVTTAGLTHAMSGIGEAFPDGIPMLVIPVDIQLFKGKLEKLPVYDLLKDDTEIDDTEISETVELLKKC